MEEISVPGKVVKPATCLIRYVVDFTASRLKTSYEDNFNEFQTLSDEQRQVHALIEVHDLAQVLGGPDSAGVHEALWHLLLPRLRPELRRWYRHSDTDKRATTLLLRNYLSNFLKEGSQWGSRQRRRNFPGQVTCYPKRLRTPASGTSPIDKPKQSLDSYWDC
jgi:hypothetical protein